MFATGSQVRGWLLIEVRGAWGEDAIHASALRRARTAHWKDELKRRHIRAVCIRSRLTGRGDRRAAVSPAPPAAPAPDRRRCGAATSTSLADVVPAVEGLRVDQPAGVRSGSACRSRCSSCAPTGATTNAAPTSADRSSARCATRRGPNQVWECSHIGGDRFAANVVVLPDSLYFGRVEPASARGVAGRSRRGTNRRLALFRGRTSFSLAEQAVEHFVRRELGIDAVDGVIIDRAGG